MYVTLWPLTALFLGWPFWPCKFCSGISEYIFAFWWMIRCSGLLRNASCFKRWNLLVSQNLSSSRRKVLWSKSGSLRCTLADTLISQRKAGDATPLFCKELWVNNIMSPSYLSLYQGSHYFSLLWDIINQFLLFSQLIIFPFYHQHWCKKLSNHTTWFNYGFVLPMYKSQFLFSLLTSSSSIIGLQSVHVQTTWLISITSKLIAQK